MRRRPIEQATKNQPTGFLAAQAPFGIFCYLKFAIVNRAFQMMDSIRHKIDDAELRVGMKFEVF
jgi:hypothetical protein